MEHTGCVLVVAVGDGEQGVCSDGVRYGALELRCWLILCCGYWWLLWLVCQECPLDCLLQRAPLRYDSIRISV